MHKQLSIFEDETQYVTISDAAMQMNVSSATVRNWIKEGILSTSDRHNLLRQECIDIFIQNRLASDKLQSRANKSKKCIHNHDALTSEILNDLLLNTLSGSSISQKYETSLSESYKNKEGIYYTPSDIVEKMMCGNFYEEGKTFLEPCCGGGNFIVEAIKKGIKPEYIYGFDTDPNAIAITKRRIYELTGYHSENIICADFLDIAKWKSKEYDFIFTNPPWGKKMSKTEKDRYSKIYNAGASNDTCSLFLFACLNLLKKDGVLGFLLPEAFFNVALFEEARKKILSYNVTRLIDFGKFGELYTKAHALILRKAVTKTDIFCEGETGNSFIRCSESFSQNPKHIINFLIPENDSHVIEYLYSKPHKTLQKAATWGLGIVTGDNKKLCKPIFDQGYVPIYRGKDIFPAKVSKPTLFINEKLEGCQQVAPIQLYKAKEKIIYRFISKTLVFFRDDKQRYILNSANFLILNEDFFLTSQQLVDMLNSEVMTWLFQSIFNTHKILRGDIEQLPIFEGYYDEYSTFDEETFLKYLNIEKKNGTYRIKK